MWLYTLILIGTVSIPLMLSFEKKLQFYKQFKYLIPSILLVAAVYIIFDVFMTKNGVWGFNPNYHLNITLIGLPLEEWLFFIIIPYASIFLHDSFVLYFPKIRLPNVVSSVLSILLMISLVLLAVLHFNNIYTAYISLKGTIVLGLSIFDKSKLINHFYITFLIILIPFIVVNGILTGTFIDNEVVWYNNCENLGIRVLTIPVEDFVYGFSLILFVLLIRAFLKSFLNK